MLLYAIIFQVTECFFTVTVVDDESPLIAGITCFEAINISTDAGACVGTQDFDLSKSTDNCAVTGYNALVLNTDGT
jgi:hypothetical protein